MPAIPLDNPVWYALTGPHANIAIGRGGARHYPRDKAPFSAIAEPLAEEPVSSEPVSGPNSLLTGKITGNFAKLGPIDASVAGKLDAVAMT
jgi:hypothetical protein